MLLRNDKRDEEKPLLQQIKDFFAVPAAMREIIGRATYVTGDFWRQVTQGRKSIDETRADYAFWDRLRRGKAKGFEIAGLFARPITQVLASWVMGGQIMGSLTNIDDDYTNNLLRRFLRRIHGELLGIIEDLYALGDQFIIINPDGSLTSPSPETVVIEYDPTDYRRMTAVKIVTRYEKNEITEVYTARYRERTIKWADGRIEVKRWNNLIGRIPVVHFANDRGANEVNGRPVYEAMYRLLARYDTLMEKALDGAELLGNPIPAFEGVEDIDETIRANSDPTQNYTDEMGNEYPVLNWSRMQAIFVGAGGTFEYKSPRANFTGDVREMLKVLFLLVLEFTRIPEAVWGGELTSSRSTAQEQMKTFFNYIKGRRMALEGRSSDEELGAEARGGLLELIDIWLRIKALTDPKVKVGDITLHWEHMSDMPADIRFKAVQWAYGMGLIGGGTALKKLDIVDEDTVYGEGVQPKTYTDPFDAALDESLGEGNVDLNARSERQMAYQKLESIVS